MSSSVLIPVSSERPDPPTVSNASTSPTRAHDSPHRGWHLGRFWGGRAKCASRTRRVRCSLMTLFFQVSRDRFANMPLHGSFYTHSHSDEIRSLKQFTHLSVWMQWHLQILVVRWGNWKFWGVTHSGGHWWLGSTWEAYAYATRQWPCPPPSGAPVWMIKLQMTKKKGKIAFLYVLYVFFTLYCSSTILGMIKKERKEMLLRIFVHIFRNTFQQWPSSIYNHWLHDHWGTIRGDVTELHWLIVLFELLASFDNRWWSLQSECSHTHTNAHKCSS